jgi:NAD+ synthase (glutamine-hydrolysing)
MVYEMAEWFNREEEAIPRRVIDRPPSAELRPDQKDQDSLPPYEDLDSILSAFVEEHRSRDEILQSGHDREAVDKVLRLINLNEYKRSQAAPGLRVTTKAFGFGRRMPIAKSFDVLMGR